MTDAAPDKEKRKHGAIWYVPLLLFAYVASCAPALAVLEWTMDRGVVSHNTAELLSLVYLPVFLIIHVLGFDSEFTAVTDAILRFLP